MLEWKVEKVAVTLHLTPEADRILRQYAGERNRGLFVSELVVAQWARDQVEARRFAERAEKEATRAAQRPVAKSRRKKGR